MKSADDSERYVPTPEELEQGLRRRRRSIQDDRDGGDNKSGGEGLMFRLRRGVGRRRKYVGVEEVADSPDVPGDVAPEEAVSDVIAEVEREATKGGESVSPIESVRIRPRSARRPPPPAARVEPASKEGRFYERAKSNGHEMGPLVREPLSDNLRSQCLRCGLTGVIIVERDGGLEMNAWDFPSGPALSARCSDTG